MIESIYESRIYLCFCLRFLQMTAVLDEQGVIGDVLLALLILLAICLVVILMATCYLYNLCNCYHRMRSLSPSSHRINYQNYTPLKTNEKHINTSKTKTNFKSSTGNSKNDSTSHTKLPVLGITDKRRTIGNRKPRPDSTVILGLGRITFSLKYSEESEVLHVNLICGRQLTHRNGELARMPVVKANINGKTENEKQSSPDDTPNPEFDEVLSFLIPGNNLGESILNLTIWDSDANMFKTLIGFVRVPLANFIESLLRPAGTGPITREIDENSLNDIPMRTNGEILFSLSYTPEQDKLVVAILKCRGVVTKDDVTALHVTASLCINGKEADTKRTSSIEKFHDDVFNEMVTFEPCIRQANVTKDNISLKIVLYAESLSDEREVVGCAMVGPLTTDEGISHWREMTNSVRTAVAQWHRLIY